MLLRGRLFFQAAQPLAECAAPDPHPAARQPHRWRAGSLPAPAVEGRPGYPQLGGHLLDREQRVARGSWLVRRGGGGPAGSGLGSRGRPVRGVATTDAPLRPACQVRPPPGRRRQAAARGGRPGPAGERGKAPRSLWAAGLGLACGPALPEGKAGRGGRRVVPGGDLVRALAVAGGGGGRPWCRPAGRAGLPPGTAGIQPPLRPPRQVRPAARRGGGLDARPAATRRYGPVPARPGGAVPARGPAPGGYREGGTVARTATVRAPVVHAPAAGRRPGTGTRGCAQRVMLTGGSVIGRSLAPPGFPSTTEIGFLGPFFADAPEIGAGEAKKRGCGGRSVYFRWPFMYLARPGRVPRGKRRRSAP